MGTGTRVDGVWVEVNQRSAESTRLTMGIHDLPALQLHDRQPLPHLADLCSQGTSNSPRRAPHQVVSQPDGLERGVTELVPSGGEQAPRAMQIMHDL